MLFLELLKFMLVVTRMVFQRARLMLVFMPRMLMPMLEVTQAGLRSSDDLGAGSNRAMIYVRGG